jgi:hypothetical protein
MALFHDSPGSIFYFKKIFLLMKRWISILFFLPLFVSGQDTVFIKSYGLNGYNYGEKVIQLSDSGYILLGNKSGFVGNTDVYLVRTDFTGNFNWDRAFGGSEVNWAEDIIPTKDKGYAIAGYMNLPGNSDYNVMLIKTDSLGHMQWMKNYGGSDWDLGHSLVETPDSGFIITGETYSFGNGNNDVFLLRTDKNGDSLWAKYYGGANAEIAYDISKCHDGNYIVTGITSSFGKGDDDVYLLKTDASGDTLWTRTFGDSLDDKAFAGIETNDHGFALAGSTMNFGAKAMDAMLLKTDSTGSQKWLQYYGGTENEELYDVIQNPQNDKFFLSGYTISYGYAGTKDLYMVMARPDGWFVFGKTYGGDKTDVAYSCITTSDKGYAAIGSTESMGPGISNILLVKMDSLGESDLSSYIHIYDIGEFDKKEISVYPNPSSADVFIRSGENFPVTEILIFNQLGQTVLTSTPEESHHASIDLSGFPEGIYFIMLRSGNNIVNKKILIER